MVERKVIVDKVSTFVGEKLNEVLDSNPFSFIIKPYVSRVANNYIGKLDNKIIESAITFYFKDEDSGSTKTWNYFKTAN